jgi:hypothetical protein
MKLKLKGKGWFQFVYQIAKWAVLYSEQKVKLTGKRTSFYIAPFFGVFNKKIKVTKSGYHTPPPPGKALLDGIGICFHCTVCSFSPQHKSACDLKLNFIQRLFQSKNCILYTIENIVDNRYHRLEGSW